MNIKDFKESTLREWPEIFTLQREVNEAFDPNFAEAAENFDISYHGDQEIFKHYCWCITEELMEALEAVELEEPTHITEELTDALNFTIQLCDLYGWTAEDVFGDRFHIDCAAAGSLREAVLDAVYHIGITANCLKNRQWRESQYLVDLYEFENRFAKVMPMIIRTFKAIGVPENEIRRLWDLKYQVNKFRIDSRY